MLKSVEATIEEDGRVTLREPVRLPHVCRAIVTIIEEPSVPETALLSQEALAKDWDRPEEEEAWSQLRPAQ
jgi:hypothetical protein